MATKIMWSIMRIRILLKRRLNGQPMAQLIMSILNILQIPGAPGPLSQQTTPISPMMLPLICGRCPTLSLIRWRCVFPILPIPVLMIYLTITLRLSANWLLRFPMAVRDGLLLRRRQSSGSRLAPFPGLTSTIRITPGFISVFRPSL